MNYRKLFKYPSKADSTIVSTGYQHNVISCAINGLLLSTFLLIVIIGAPAHADAFLKLDEPQQTFLPKEQAFALNARFLDDSQIQFSWSMPPGYYLYRQRIHFKITGGELGLPIFPNGIPKHDEYLGDYEIYEQQLQVALAFNGNQPKFYVTAEYQGCAASGYCYPPMHTLFQFDIAKHNVEIVDAIPSKLPTTIPVTSSQDQILALFTEKSLGFLLLAFLGFGMLLSFTPCVLPMVPILSGIILGEGPELTRRESFILSCTYVLGLASTYAVAGSIAGLIGQNFQSVFQNPWMLSLMALMFVGLALSLFGFYELRLPHRLENHLHEVHRNQEGGTYLGVFVMGILSALIVSPCVTPPLVGALAYISQTGNTWVGGLALFCLGLGMGIPLIAITTIGMHLLPKRGYWMETVKHFFGVIFIAMAVALLGRFLPGNITLFLWGAFAISNAVYLGVFNRARTNLAKCGQGFGLVLFIVGVEYIIGAGLGHDDWLHPLKTRNDAIVEDSQPSSRFVALEPLQEALTDARNLHQPVLIKFSAEWCLACHIMDRTVFNQPAIKALLTHGRVFTVDLSQNTKETKKVQEFYGVFAPPTYLFIDKTGEEQKGLRLVGETTAKNVQTHLEAVGFNK